MNARPYKIIFVLLSFCVLFILVLQAYWIRNFYLQKTEEFDRNVYSSLEVVRDRINQLKNVETLKMTYLLRDGDTLSQTPIRKRVLKMEGAAKTINKNILNISATRVVSIKEQGSDKTEKEMIVIDGNDNINISVNGRKAMVMVKNKTKTFSELVKKSKHLPEKPEELESLVDKMITEIKVMDTDYTNSDTVVSIIKKTLNNKGLFLPFEFSLQKQAGNKKTILAQSASFNQSKDSYKSDLSESRIFDTHQFLFIQFTGQRDFVLAAMKNSLILSLIFSLLIISAFYYTMRLIFRQKKLSEIKNDFVNNMTHELKTPIATISLALDAIQNPLVKNDPAVFKNYGRILKEENQKLNNHVERVLQMALLDKGQLQLVKEPVDLVSAIEWAIDHYKLQIADQKTAVYFIPPVEKMRIEGDLQHLQTVFGNLLDNALKYSSENCAINISMKGSEKQIMILIKDNGIGLAREQREKIFDKFYRVQGGNLHDVKGFGLGLSYVRSIVEAHNGSISVESEKGRGCEFTVSFPLIKN